MIAEDLLERGLNIAGDSYDVPAGGVDRIRDELAPAAVDDRPTESWRTSPMRWRPSGRGWAALGAAAMVVLIVAAFAVGGKSPVSTRTNAGGGGVQPALGQTQ